MLCLGPKKSLTSPRLKLTAQGVAYRCSKVECEDHSAIQAPLPFFDYGVATFIPISNAIIFFLSGKQQDFGVKFNSFLLFF